MAIRRRKRYQALAADVYSHAIRGRDDEAARRWEEFQGGICRRNKPTFSKSGAALWRRTKSAVQELTSQYPEFTLQRRAVRRGQSSTNATAFTGLEGRRSSASGSESRFGSSIDQEWKKPGSGVQATMDN
jgi:hypothetical protein